MPGASIPRKFGEKIIKGGSSVCTKRVPSPMTARFGAAVRNVPGGGGHRPQHNKTQYSRFTSVIKSRLLTHRIRQL